MVAHAAELSKWNFRIYSRKVKSKLYGSQYLHQPIPNLDCGFPHIVRYQLRGTAEQYRRKVYGDDWDGTVSPEDYQEAHAAWDIRAAYDSMWQDYEDEIEDADIHRWWTVDGPDLIISTVPRKIWAEPGDVFESQKVWALGDTEMPRVEPAYRPEPFSVICEASLTVPWYRVSNIFDYCTIEWPFDPLKRLNSRLTLRPPMPGASVVEKPLRHNSKAASDFVHLGRYGSWEKGVLSTDAFFDAMKVFANDKIS